MFIFQKIIKGREKSYCLLFSKQCFKIGILAKLTVGKHQHFLIDFVKIMVIKVAITT